jgi:hypothetical protein
MSTDTRGRNKPQDIITVERTPLQWANGRTEYLQPSGRYGPLVGFHIEVGLSVVFDALAAEAALPKITIRHTRDNAPPAYVEHWSLGESVRVYPLTYGPLATTMRGATEIADRMADEAGIVASWGDRSYLGLLVLVETAAGVCRDPLLLSAKSRQTPHLYDALLGHLAMCESADAVAGIEVPCAWIGLPLVAGTEFAAGGDKTTNIIPLRANYDDAPAEIDAAYLSRISLPRELRAFARDCTAKARDWARGALRTQQQPRRTTAR